MSRAAFKLIGSLHVYGMCAWTGPIAKVGRRKPEGKPIYVKGCSIPIPHVSLPCCPHCGSLLMQTSEAMWQKGLAETDAECPGYADFFAWKEAQPKCWPSIDDAVVEYNQVTGKTFKLPIPKKT